MPFLGDAHERVARFDAVVGNLPDAQLLLSPLTVQETVLSSRIEGTQASLEEVLRFQADGNASGKKRNDILEVMNYRQALEVAFDRMKEIPLSARLIKEAHKILLSGVRGEQKDPGNFRTGQVHIGLLGGSIADAKYIPPEAQQIPELFSNLETYASSREGCVGATCHCSCSV